MMARQPEIIAQLVHIEGPLKGEIQEFSESKIDIGRNPSCVVRFPADLVLVSRNHASIVREGNSFRLVDSSTNGTFVNGKRVKSVVLKSGDVITLTEGGPKFSFLTEIREGKAVIDTPPPKMRAATPIVAEEVIRDNRQRRTAETVPEEQEAPVVIQYGPTLRSFKMVPIIIGKDPKCDVVLEHPSLLDRHAEIFFVDGQYWVKDLTGTGTVQINGKPVGPGLPVSMQDEVILAASGPAFRFLGQGRFAEVERTPAGEPRQDAEKTNGKPAGEKEEDRPVKGQKSLFKKYFHR